MEDLSNPRVYQIANPIGFDEVISRINTNLSTSPILEKIFGRAYILEEVPKVWLGDDYFQVFPNDALRAFSFVRGLDPLENVVSGEQSGTDIRMVEKPASIIIHGNYNRVDPTKGYPFVEEIIQELTPLISQTQGVFIKTIYSENIEEVYGGYDLPDDVKKLLYYPYFGIRYDINVSYSLIAPCQ